MGEPASLSIGKFGAALALAKTADITSSLEPHQQRIVDKAQNQNLLVAHGMGSGKSLASLAAADAIGMPTEIFTPAPLTKNYEKEIGKHTGSTFVPYNLHSVSTAAQRNYQIPEGATMIVDEAHLARNPSSERSQYLKEQARRAGRVMLLTGTPTYNQPENLAPLVNMISKEDVLPENPTDFRKKFITEREVKPGLLGRLLGMKSGRVPELKNRKQLVDAMRGKVDIFTSSKDLPGRVEKNVYVDMSPQQDDVYRYIEGTVPWYLKMKIHMNLPPNKQEAQQLNAFSAGMRQSSNTHGPYVAGMSPLAAAKGSPKMVAAMDSIKDKMSKDKNFRGVVYSNYLEAGIQPMSAMLKAHNVPHAIFHGGLGEAERKQIVKDYNEGNIKVLLGTSAASEGLDLKGTKLIQILEPHFNESKTEQVIGRGIRFGSHSHLPEEERNVEVERYFSRPRQGFLSKLFSGPETGIDEYIRERALEKKKVEDQIRGALAEAQGS